MMLDYDSLEEFRDPLTYDVVCDPFNEDFTLMDQWAGKVGGPLLDVACGTGRMSIRLAAQGYSVTGVDVVPEMIGRAREKAAERQVAVEWVVSDARSFHLGKQFPFAFMIMNAFQFLPTRQDYEAMLGCIREHLTPDGYFLFETRNPNVRNLMQERHPEGETFALPDGGQLVVTDEQHYDPLTQIQHYTSLYQWLQAGTQQVTKQKVLRVGLRYIYPQEMEALLHYNGFKVHTVYGSWQGEPLSADSPAMIYVVQKRADF
jgi:2-polyprenyl-3-methyl-5-hydroxy-6-metoxy-1,4-benzoquinol methylase